ncbi:MAG: hypothetical protein Q9200_004761 [Gallowayella weberi]
MQHQPPNGWLALLREKDVKQLLDVARKQLQDCTIKNYKKESFISMDDVKRATATEEIDALFTKYERQSPIDGLPIEGLQWKDSRMLFAVALLANLEDVYVRLLLEGLKDDLLFDDHEFTTLCQSADATVDRLKSIRNLFGAIVRPGKLQVFSKGVILPYPTRAKLDNGSYGQVYKVKIARDHLKGSDEVRWKLVPPAYITNQSQRVVAEKEIRPSDDGMGSKEEWDRLCRETSTLEKRQHPNIIPLLGSYFFEFEESEIEKKTLHLIFPLADQNLASWMACAPNLEAEQRTRIDIYRRIYRLVSSLSYLHRELPDGFTSHHDIKPSNILVFGSEFKFADFGASHLRSSISGSETARPHLGTYEYHPPEYWGDDGRKASSLHGRSFDAWPMGYIEERTLDGKTALFLAIERGYIATTEMLLDLGAQIFTQCRQGNTPIHAVASAEDIPLDESLLARIFGEKEAVQCFEHKNQFGQTPIALALLHQNLECFRLLKEKSASIHTVNDKGENLLHIMATMGHYDDLMGYVDEFDQSAFEDKDIRGMTPSMIAEKCQNLRWLGLFESRRVRNSTGPESIPAVKDQPNFYTLNAGEPWLSEHKGSRYWEHLTYHSFAIYETIYHRCKRGRAEIQCMFTKESHSGSRNIASGNLTINIVTDFAAQFFNSWPNERTQRQAWERLLQPPYKPYPKPIVLAILYMLHLEQFSTKKQNTITDERFNILTRFDLWIGCRCSQTCGKQWNFVNRIGMYRPLDVQTSACKAVQALKNRLVPAEIPQRKSYNPFHRKQDNRNQDNGRVLEDMYEEWKLYK